MTLLAVSDATPVPPLATDMLDSVLLAPLIVLFDSVVVLVAVRTFDGVMMFESTAMRVLLVIQVAWATARCGGNLFGM
jgi:hypothetical protein